MALQPSTAYSLSYHDQALWERGDLSLAGIREAWKVRRDKRLAEYIVKLAQLDPRPEGYDDAIKAGAQSYDQLLTALRPWTLRRSVRTHHEAKGGRFSVGSLNRQLLRESIREVHQAQWDTLAGSKSPIPERLLLHEVLMELWESDEAFDRESLLEVLRYIPLKWGPWKAIRAIFKASIRKRDWEVFGIICARVEIDRLTGREGAGAPRVPFNVSWNHSARDVSARTLSYLQRYAWRVLRHIAQNQPSLYPEVAAQVLKAYPAHLGTYQLTTSWIYNHILFHQAPGYARKRRSYSAERFYHYASDYYTHRAYPDLWKIRIEPLLGLLEVATHTGVMRFTTEALLKDFRDHLKTLDASWVTRVASHKRETLDGFLVTWFRELCPYTQAEYSSHGLHRPLLTLLWSSHKEMSEYALTYFKAHPDALAILVTVEQLMGFAQSERASLRALAESLLDPQTGRYTLTLDQWTTLLCRRHSHRFAGEVIKKIFSSKDLSFGWFARCINDELDDASRFAMDLLKDSNYQPEEGDLFLFYWELLQPKTWRSKVSAIAFEGLEQQKDDQRLLSRLSSAQLWSLLLHPEREGARVLKTWVKNGWLSPVCFTVDHLKKLLLQEQWSERWWLELLDEEALEWRQQRSYDRSIGELALEWLLAGQYFSVEDLDAKWVLDATFHEDWVDQQYFNFVSAHFEMKHFVALNEVPPKTPRARDGAEALIQAFMDRRSYGVRHGLRQLIETRHVASVLAKNPNAKIPVAKKVLKDDLLTFELFERLCDHQDEEVRELGLYFARYELKRWTLEAPLTFRRLLPFFLKGAAEVQQALLKAMGTSPHSAEARIDVRLEQFKADELYAFCFSPKAQVRDLGLSLISQYPDRFMDPAQLALLSESNDRRVCEGVVKTLYAALRFKESTCPWAPSAESVAPRSDIAKKQAEIVWEAPPMTSSPSASQSKRYLGLGSSVPRGVDPQAAEWMTDFLRRTVFRLSPGHPFKEDLNRLTPSTSAWRTKVNLIKALRDFATQHDDFARLIAPILSELLNSRGRSERAACLVALARIRAAHPDLNV